MATHAERNRITRTKLLESAMTCIAERGYAGATATVICSHAGVTRGALNHQYDKGKFGLIKELVEVTFSEQVKRFYANREQNPALILLDMLDALKADPESEVQLVLMEIWLAMRSDEKLATLVGPVFKKSHDKFWQCIDEPMHPEPEKALAISRMSRVFLNGLSFNRLDPSIKAHQTRENIETFSRMVRHELNQESVQETETAAI